MELNQRVMLPNATATLVLGILSIVMSCCCYGILGLGLGIVALGISGSSVKLYKANPDMYDGFGNLNAGRICAIIGISLGAIFLIFSIIYIAILGFSLPWEEMMKGEPSSWDFDD